MRIGVITDTHINFKKGNQIFHEYFEKFYKNIFFPTLEKYGVDTVIHMGDMFDNRKSTDYWSIEWARRVIFDPLKKYNVYVTVGNHDTTFKNSTNLNSPELLLADYDNVKIYTKTTEVKIGNLNVLLVPWIASDDEQKALQAIQRSQSKVCMGHLELNGFCTNGGQVQMNGRDKSIFKNFDRVFSGHYHTRSDDGKIFYIGNPYELYWSDYNDKRGFVIFDTQTFEIIHIDNPYQMYKIINYDDSLNIDVSQYENCIVKIIVKDNKNKLKYEKFLDSLLTSNLQDLKVIEQIKVNDCFDASDHIENEDTLSLLNMYVDESEIDLNKDKLKSILSTIYQESFLV